MNASIILNKYGISNYQPGSPEVDVIPFSINKQVGRIEGGPSIDTAEEAATAFIINDPSLLTKDLAMQACTMWYMKWAENPGNCNNWIKAIKIIMDKAGIRSEDEVKGYYARAIQEKVEDIVARRFSGPIGAEQKDQVSRVVTQYYINPSQENYKKLVELGTAIFKKAAIDNSYRVNSLAFYETLDDLSPTFRNKVHHDL